MNTVFWKQLSLAVFREAVVAPNIRYNGRLPGPLPVTELLAETVGLAGASLARLCGKPVDQVHVDGRLCALWGGTSCQTIGWAPPEPWDPLSSIFRGTDGWIRLHCNAPHHRAAAIRALGGASTREAVADEISRQSVAALEERVVGENGAAASMIPWAIWTKHPQGRAVSRTPLVEWDERTIGTACLLRHADFGSDRPLSGIKVLDLTRVLAGPVATRTLAGFGAQILRIDPEGWDDPGLLQDTTLGKRCAELNLTNDTDRNQFEQLLREADILVHGYRPGALDGLGYNAAVLDQINPLRIDVSLSAYGRQGPWANRRGFDSLVQFSSGIAEICGDADGSPGTLPVQALDHAAGYLLAAIALEALRRARAGDIVHARISLARVSWLLCGGHQIPESSEDVYPVVETDFEDTLEYSDWGSLKRLRPPLVIPSCPMYWEIPSGGLRRHSPKWS